MATLLTLTATRINGEKQTTPKTVYLNPDYVVYGIPLTSGTNITYQVDKNVLIEYNVTETVAAMATATSGALAAIQVVQIFGDVLRQPKTVLLNTRMVTSVSAAKNPANGTLTYSKITYSRDGRLKEQLISPQQASALSTVLATPTGTGGGAAIPLYTSTGQNTDGAMTQKAASDKFTANETAINQRVRYIDGRLLTPDGQEMEVQAVMVIGAGKNKFNPAAVVSGFYIDGATGATVAGAGYSISEQFAVEENTTYKLSGYGTVHHAIGLAYYDAAGVVLGKIYAVNLNVAESTTAIITPAGCTRVAFTVKTAKAGDNTDINTIQFEEGQTKTTYEPYAEKIVTINGKSVAVNGVVTDKTKPDSPVSVSYLNENVVLGENIQKAPIGKNLFNPNAVLHGYYIHSTTGVLTAAPGYSVSPVIPIKPNRTYTISGLATIHHGLGVAFYNAAGELILRRTTAADVTTYTTTSPALTASFRFTWKTGKTGEVATAENIQVEGGGDSDRADTF